MKLTADRTLEHRWLHQHLSLVRADLTAVARDLRVAHRCAAPVIGRSAGRMIFGVVVNIWANCGLPSSATICTIPGPARPHSFWDPRHQTPSGSPRTLHGRNHRLLPQARRRSRYARFRALGPNDEAVEAILSAHSTWLLVVFACPSSPSPPCLRSLPVE
jgi:hypothetical protein